MSDEKQTYKISPLLQGLQRAASWDVTRFNIRGVAFKETHAAATDGHILAVIKYNDEDKAGNLPVGKNIRFPKFSRHQQPMYALREFYCPECEEFLEESELEERDETDTNFVEVNEKLISSESDIGQVLKDGEFPPAYTDVLVTHKKPFQIALDASLLLKLVRALGGSEMGTKTGVVLQVDLENPTAPMLVAPTSGAYSPNARIGAIMPMRTEETQVDFNKLRDTMLGSKTKE